MDPLVTHLPSGFRTLILSRTALPAAYVRLKAHCKMGIITWEDLKLEFDETSSIIDLKATAPVSDQIKKEIHQRCEGWAAGLSLIWQFIRTKKMNYQLPDKIPEEIFDYFAEEVFNSINDETKEFLIKSSFLTDIRTNEAITLTGNQKAKDILLDLQQLNFFINQPDETGLTFRFHPLFAEFLQKKAQEWMNLEEILLTRKMAGDILERAGKIEEAISLYFSCDDYDLAIRAIMQNALALISQGRNNLLLSWLSRIPETLKAKSPWLFYWAGIARITFEPLASYTIFEEAYILAADRKDMLCRLLSFAGILDSIFYGGEDFTVLDKWIDHYVDLEAEIETCPDIDIQLRVAGSIVTTLIVRRPQHPKIEFWIERFLNQKITLQNSQFMVSVLCQIAWYFNCYKADFKK